MDEKADKDVQTAIHTCPMHPEVRQTTPGDCPLCGMGLELDSAAGGAEGPNPELVDFAASESLSC